MVKILDANGNPISNPSVVVQNTKSGTTTKDDGSFSLIVPNNARVLTITAVGMVPQEISIGSETNFNVPGRKTFDVIKINDMRIMTAKKLA